MKSLSVLLLAACHREPGSAEDKPDPTTDPPTTTDTTTPPTTDTTPPSTALVPEWGANPTFVTVADASAPLAVPRDLQFHPDRPNELWVANRATDSITVVFDPDTDGRASAEYDDAYGNHFMEEVSSIAFGVVTEVPDEDPVSSFGSCQESRNTYDDVAPPNDFMGPALWPGDLDMFAQVHQNDALLGSHLDMLHQSPLCMGIAHDADNAYWVFDGMHAMVVYYDFQVPHGYGEEDHHDGIVRTYPEADVLRVPDVPGHLVLDEASGMLYVADTGHGRVLALDTRTGSVAQPLPSFSNGEPLEEHSEMGGVDVVVLAEGLSEPSGVALHDGRLFVSDHAAGEIVAYTLDGEELARLALPDGAGVMGLEIGPDGTLWYVDGDHELVVHVIPGD